MADPQTSTPSATSKMNPSVPKDERISEEERSVGGSDEAALPGAGANETIITPASESPDGIDNEATSSHPQQTTTSNPQPAQKAPLFGIPQSSGTRPNFHPNYDDDYETRFPPDPIYQEASENARVFRVYMEEAAKYDALMTDEGREGLDVNLVFAGLFSAVLTTFLAQTSQSLQPDRATESTLLLREMLALQRAQMNSTSADSVPPTSTNFVPSAIDVWVNGLWFTSLTLSLASALFAVLIKQWIRHYMSHTSGTVRKRSLIHQFRLRGLQKWHVLTLINILPVLMHLSLAIFFAGLTLFLLPLRCSIASVVGSASACIFLAYIGTAVWPMFHVQCPYYSPLTNILYGLLVHLRMLQDRRRDAAMKDEVPCFEWLYRISSNPSVHRLVTQAFGGCLHRSPAMTRLINTAWEKPDHISIFHSTWNKLFSESWTMESTNSTSTPLIWRIRPEKVDLLEQLFRSALHLGHPSRSSHYWATREIQDFSAPTLQWEAAATAVLWHFAKFTKDPYKNVVLTQKACSVVDRLMSNPRDQDKQLPLIVWENLLAAANSRRQIPLQRSSDQICHLDRELTARLCWGYASRKFVKSPWDFSGWKHVPYPVSFHNALAESEDLVWSLLLPFNKYKRNAKLDSKKVQRLLSLVNAIIFYGPSGVRSDVFFGAWKELTCELQAGSVTRKDQDAICETVDTFLRGRNAFQAILGPNAVLLPSLPFLYCWTPTSRSARTDVVLVLIEMDMFEVLEQVRSILSHGNDVAPFLSILASIIRASFESSSVDAASHPEDLRWLEYLSLPKNRAAVVSSLTFQGSTSAPARTAQVSDDLSAFLASQSQWDGEVLQKCRASLDEYLEYFIPPKFRDDYRPNMKEARRVIDKLIAKQSRNTSLFSRLLRRSAAAKSSDPEAITLPSLVDFSSKNNDAESLSRPRYESRHGSLSARSGSDRDEGLPT